MRARNQALLVGKRLLVLYVQSWFIKKSDFDFLHKIRDIFRWFETSGWLIDCSRTLQIIISCSLIVLLHILRKILSYSCFVFMICRRDQILSKFGMILIKIVGIDNRGKLELPFLLYLEVKFLSFDTKTGSNVLASVTFCRHIFK